MPKKGGSEQERSKELRAWLDANQPKHPEEKPPQLPQRAYDLMEAHRVIERQNLSEQDKKTFALIDKLNQKLDILLSGRVPESRFFRLFLMTHYPASSVASLQIDDDLFEVLIDNDIFMVDELREWLTNPGAQLKVSIEQNKRVRQSNEELVRFLLERLEYFDTLTSGDSESNLD